ncbi:MAG: efflux RND transporter periplasmic adaptor subunit [Ignavibacteria bacterium]|nr:efflux RND transporter periplasmic adaptor subunit [Ignavibacteria bacterium]
MKGTKKKITIFAIILLALLSIGLLFNNRNKNIAKSKKITILTTFPVYVHKASFEDMDINLEYNGTVLPNSELNIASETNGKVVGVFASLGNFVKKGTILVKLDDRIRLANLQTAKSNYEKTKKDLERYEKLFKENSISETQLEMARFQFTNAEAQYAIATKQLEETKISAPFSGFVSAKMVEVGQVVSPGTPLLTLIDIGTVKIRFQVPEKDIFKIKIGDVVEVSTDLLPNQKFYGKVHNIGFKADEAKTYPVEVDVKNPKNLLKAGMFVQVRIPSAMRVKALLIPRVALFGSKLDPKVYVVENNIAKIRPITLGGEFGDKIEVIKGLKEGELIITEGLINLKDGTPVNIVEQK